MAESPSSLLNIVNSFHDFVTSKTGNYSYLVYALLTYFSLKTLYNFFRFFRRRNIKGTTVLITGASQGIGKAAVTEFAKNGAKKIFILARSSESLHEIALEINKQYQDVVVPYPVDCSNGDQVELLAKEIISKYGVPDIIVNSAGAGRWRYLWEMSCQEIKDCVNAPYLAAAFICRSFLPEMIKRNSGVIVNVQSPAAYTAFGGSTAYLSNRWALRGLSEALRADVDGTKINIQEVIFGETKSNYFDNNAGSAERIPWIGRIAPAITPEYCASKIISSIKFEENTNVFPPPLRLTIWLSGWIPSVMNYLVRKTGWTLTKDAKSKKE